MNSTFLDCVNLSQFFQATSKEDDLLSYYTIPRKALNDHNGFTENCYELMKNRSSVEMLIGYAPQDSTIFKVRFDILNNNNEAFAIASKDNPTVLELEQIAKMHASWAWLFPIKIFLHQHLELAKQYRGLLPLGKCVIAFINALVDTDGIERREIKGQPTYKDHVEVQNISNRIADLQGCTTIAINDKMYLIGKRMLDNMKE